MTQSHEGQFRFPLYDRNTQSFVPNIFWARPHDFAKAILKPSPRNGRIARRLGVNSARSTTAGSLTNEGPYHHNRAVGRHHVWAAASRPGAPEGARGRSADRQEGAHRL